MFLILSSRRSTSTSSFFERADSVSLASGDVSTPVFNFFEFLPSASCEFSRSSESMESCGDSSERCFDFVRVDLLLGRLSTAVKQ